MAAMKRVFPSPCGVQAISIVKTYQTGSDRFPSPYGVWVASKQFVTKFRGFWVSVPLRGMGYLWQQRGLRLA